MRALRQQRPLGRGLWRPSAPFHPGWLATRPATKLCHHGGPEYPCQSLPCDPVKSSEQLDILGGVDGSQKKGQLWEGKEGEHPYL